MMLNITRSFAALLIAVIVFSSAYGQARMPRGYRKTPSQVPRYAPSSPTVSPFVNLTGRDGSAASNYFGIIRPLERQQSLNAQQERQARAQSMEIEQLIREQEAAFDQPRVRPTGTGSWFQQPGHFYNQWGSAGRRR
jgi:hypothetical protein